MQEEIRVVQEREHLQVKGVFCSLKMVGKTRVKAVVFYSSATGHAATPKGGLGMGLQVVWYVPLATQKEDKSSYVKRATMQRFFKASRVNGNPLLYGIPLLFRSEKK